MAIKTLLNTWLDPNQLLLASRWRWYPGTLPIHDKIVAIYVPKMPMQTIKPDILLCLCPLVTMDGCLTILYPFKDPNQLLLGRR